jgi:hypothetical protein
MSDDAELLNFLTDGLVGTHRDLITRSYYALTQGNPDSAPVHITNLLTACTRRIVQAPADLRVVNGDFKKTLLEAKDFEHRLIDRVNRNKTEYLAEFKDETARLTLNLSESSRLNQTIVAGGKEMVVSAMAIVAQAERVTTDLGLLHGDLQLHQDDTKQIAQGTEEIKTIFQNVRDLVKDLTKEVRANWMTVGFVTGMMLDSTIQQSQAPPWVGFILCAVGVGLIQRFVPRSWKFVEKRAGKLETNNKG